MSFPAPRQCQNFGQQHLVPGVKLTSWRAPWEEGSPYTPLIHCNASSYPPYFASSYTPPIRYYAELYSDNMLLCHHETLVNTRANTHSWANFTAPAQPPSPYPNCPRVLSNSPLPIWPPKIPLCPHIPRA